MPWLDGSGPAGMGPMTGGARGRCAPSGLYGARYLPLRRFLWPLRMGRALWGVGRRFWGRGRGWAGRGRRRW